METLHGKIKNENDLLKYAMVLHIMNRGTAEIIEESDTGIFMHDSFGDAYTIINDDRDQGIQWMLAHEKPETAESGADSTGRPYDIMAVYGEPLIEFAKERYGFPKEEHCYQGAWIKDSAPDINMTLSLRPVQEGDRKLFLSNYDFGNDEWFDEMLSEDAKYMRLFVGEAEVESEDGAGKKKVTVGFIGTHPEGSMGMLEILPEYRLQGYAQELEIYMIDKILKEGGIPHGHVIIGNEKSMALQKKLGFDFWDGVMSWLHD